MHLHRRLPKLLAILLLSACIDLPEVDVAPDQATSSDGGSGAPPDNAGQQDAETTDPTGSGNDAGAGTDGGEQQALSAKLMLPGDETHVRGAVSLQVETSEPQPDKVELFAGEVLIAELLAPYRYTWDTTSFAEGTYSLSARVTKGDRNAVSEGRPLTIDRTAPRVQSRAPGPEESFVSSGETIQVEFSEALGPDTLNDGSVFLHINGVNTAKRLALSAGGKSLLLAPTAPIAVPSTVSVTLASGIKDLAGNGLEAAPMTWKWQVPAWIPVGANSGLDLPSVRAPVLRLHSTTGPVLAALASSGAEELGPVVSRWTGTSWERLGGFLGVAPYDPESQDYSQYEGLAFEVDEGGTPVVSWTENSSTGTATYLRRWSNSRWSAIPFTGESSPSLQLTSADNPWTATRVWDAQTPGEKVQVRWWNGQAWQDFGAGLRASTTSNRIYSISFALDGDGFPIVAWNEAEQVSGSYTNQRIHVRRWKPAGWAALGSAISANAGGSAAFSPVLRLSRAGVPVLAWSEPNTPLTKTKAADIHIRAWEGGQWRQLGSYLSASTGETPASAPSLALTDEGVPFIAWRETDATASKVHVRRWNGTDWETIEGTASAIEASAKAGELSLQLDASGSPWVTWVNEQRVAHVYRFNR